ncbi:MAG TPA: hypothetical protein VGJ60_07125 [Chloroflexota bacterium]
MGVLKAQPVGRNWQYHLAYGQTLLRNVGSVDPANDGWQVSNQDPRLVSAHVHISPEVALLLLKGLRAQQLRDRDPVNLPCGAAYWVDFRGNAHEVSCGSWHGGERSLCEGCTARAERDYPQGWRGYPGDVCRHGTYVGGSGRDVLCGRCEMGD